MEAIGAVIDIDAEPYELPDNEPTVRVEAEKAAVARILVLRAEGNSYRTIARMLAEEGHQTGFGANWCTSSVSRACRGKRRLGREAGEVVDIPDSLPTNLTATKNIGKFSTADARLEQQRTRGSAPH